MINNKDIRKTKKIYVEWADACTTIGWNHSPELVGLSNIATIGYLVHEDKEKIVVSSSVSANGNCVDPLAIPKGWITKRKNIK